MDTDILDIIFITALLIAIIFVFIKISLWARKHGGSITTIMIASTYEFLNADKRKAAEQIVEVKANKKMEEQSTNKPIG